MNILIFSDIHYKFDKEEINYINSLQNIDVVILCGDIIIEVLEIINVKFAGKIPVYYVSGNHDDPEQYLKYPDMKNLHLKTVDINGIIFGGYEGCFKYKENNPYHKTHKESIAELKNLPHCDIFITHDVPYNIFKFPEPHCGLKGITKFIKKKKPKINLCGHVHRDKTAKIKESDIICTYRIKFITL